MYGLALLVAGLLLAACGVSPESGTPAPPVTPPYEQLETEWTTYQGNASRTGYVPIGVNPDGFHERFLIVVSDGAPLTQAITDGERVFVSSNGSLRKIHAFDASTGALCWEHDFGPVGLVHPPAYANGRVYVTTGGSGSSLSAFDAVSGALEFQTSYSSQHGRYMAPAVRGGVVFGGGGQRSGGIFAMDAVTGQPKWIRRINQYDGYTPTLDASLVYVYTGPDYDYHESGLFRAFDRKTGLLDFEIEDPHFMKWFRTMDQAPVLGHFDNALCVNWGYYGGRIVSFDLGRQRLAWDYGDQFKGQITLINYKFYVLNGHAIEERRESDGFVISRFSLPSHQSFFTVPMAPMIATYNALFICGKSGSDIFKTYAVNINTKQTMWTYDLHGALSLSRQGILFIATQDGRLAALDIN